MGMGAIFGQVPGDRPMHGPWLEGQILYATRIRELVLRGDLHEKESAAERTRFRKYEHDFPALDRPRDWTASLVAEFESEKRWEAGGMHQETE